MRHAGRHFYSSRVAEKRNPLSAIPTGVRGAYHPLPDRLTNDRRRHAPFGPLKPNHLWRSIVLRVRTFFLAIWSAHSLSHCDRDNAVPSDPIKARARRPPYRRAPKGGRRRRPRRRGDVAPGYNSDLSGTVDQSFAISITLDMAVTGVVSMSVAKKRRQ